MLLWLLLFLWLPAFIYSKFYLKDISSDFWVTFLILTEKKILLFFLHRSLITDAHGLKGADNGIFYFRVNSDCNYNHTACPSFTTTHPPLIGCTNTIKKCNISTNVCRKTHHRRWGAKQQLWLAVYNTHSHQSRIDPRTILCGQACARASVCVCVWVYLTGIPAAKQLDKPKTWFEPHRSNFQFLWVRLV